MVETKLIQVDNETLTKEYFYFIAVESKSLKTEERENYLSELSKIFEESD